MKYYGTGKIKDNKISIGKINQYTISPKSFLLLTQVENKIVIIDFDISGYLETPQVTVKGMYFA